MYAEESTSGFAFETLTVDNTAGGVACTAATHSPGGAPGASRAVFGPVEDASIRYTWDGTAPTTTVGHLANIGNSFALDGPANIGQFRAIRTGGTNAKVPVTYER